MATPLLATKMLASRALKKIAGHDDAAHFRDYALDPAEAATDSDFEHGDLMEIFLASDRHLAHKWLQYFEPYERHLAKWRGTPVNFLEIGVSQGGSLDMWRRYFGEQARITGIDIDEACAKRVDPPNRVMIGSQDDERFLSRVLDEIGPPDVILDDGSHVAHHQFTSFEVLFPALKSGGLYIIEDAHTSYWAKFEGGYGWSGTAVDMAKSAMDDIHHPYHDRGLKLPMGDHIRSVHAYDSVLVFEKGEPRRPAHVRIGPAS